MSRPRTVYRGKRKYGWLITLAVSVLVLCVIFAVWMFYYLQRFLIYDKDGLWLDLSARQGVTLDAASQEDGDFVPAYERVDVEIVVEPRNYDEIHTSAGENVRPIRGVVVAADELNETTLRYYADSMGDFDALVLELMGADGLLRWHSGVSTADSFAVNGTLELAKSAAMLKEQGVYLTAQLSALADSTMAQRNAPIALKNAAGGVYTDGGSAYLDPYSEGTRSYLTALMAELAGMGFDEILLSGFVCPDSTELRFSSTMTRTPDASEALCSLALYLREQADALGIALSVVMEDESLRSEGIRMGQNPVMLLHVFDRVAAETAYGDMEQALSGLEAVLGEAAPSRILPVTDGFAPECECYLVR